jgi:hypothetical protein
MPDLVPGIHVFLCSGDKDVDGRDKPGHDVDRSIIMKVGITRPIKDPPWSAGARGPADRVQFCSRGRASLQMKRMLAEVRLVSDTPVRLTMSDAYTWRLAVEL